MGLAPGAFRAASGTDVMQMNYTMWVLELHIGVRPWLRLHWCKHTTTWDQNGNSSARPCSIQPMLFLTQNQTTLTAAISKMTASGSTIISDRPVMGMAHGVVGVVAARLELERLGVVRSEPAPA
jgi:hypothetical protein